MGGHTVTSPAAVQTWLAADRRRAAWKNDCLHCLCQAGSGNVTQTKKETGSISWLISNRARYLHCTMQRRGGYGLWRNTSTTQENTPVHPVTTVENWGAGGGWWTGRPTPGGTNSTKSQSLRTLTDTQQVKKQTTECYETRTFIAVLTTARCWSPLLLTYSM